MLLLKNFLENICAKHFFGLSYWAPRINSSTVLCQTRDHLLSKTFHGTKHFGKKHPPCPHIFTLLLLNKVLFASIRNGMSPETLKGEGHPTPHKQWIPNVRWRMLQKNLNTFETFSWNCAFFCTISPKFSCNSIVLVRRFQVIWIEGL